MYTKYVQRCYIIKLLSKSGLLLILERKGWSTFRFLTNANRYNKIHIKRLLEAST
jgi:hypothetical protein